MKFTNDDVEKFKKALRLNEEVKILEHDKTMDSRMSHSTCFELSDVVELMDIEKIKCKLKSK